MSISRRNAEATCLVAIVTLLIAGAALIFFGADALMSGGGIHRISENFQASMKHDIDARDIRMWADPILEGRNPKYQLTSKGVSIDPDDLPDWLKKSALGQPEFSDFDQENGAPVIQLSQGGGFGHWGLIIGRKNYVGKSDEHIVVTRWADGIYFFEQIW